MDTENQQVNSSSVESLVNIRKNIMLEIYRLCIVLGIDPDNIDYRDFAVKKDGFQAPGDTIYSLTKYCCTAVLIDKKLEAMTND